MSLLNTSRPPPMPDPWDVAAKRFIERRTIPLSFPVATQPAPPMPKSFVLEVAMRRAAELLREECQGGGPAYDGGAIWVDEPDGSTTKYTGTDGLFLRMPRWQFDFYRNG